MPGQPRRGTCKCSSRPGCCVMSGRGAAASTTSIAAASSWREIGSPGSRRIPLAATAEERDGDNESGSEEGDDEGREGARGPGRAEPVPPERRGGRPRTGGGLLRQVVRARGAEAGGLALLLHLWSGHVAGRRRVVRRQAAPGG